MVLAEEAKKVAAEFEYSAKDVNEGVKEFVRQMSMIIHQTQESDRETRLTDVRRGPSEVWNTAQPDSNICHGRTQWH